MCLCPVQIYAQIPDIEVNFSGQNKEECDDDSQLISQVFSICQRPTVPLVGGQTLITFEQEEGTHGYQELFDMI